MVTNILCKNCSYPPQCARIFTGWNYLNITISSVVLHWISQLVARKKLKFQRFIKTAMKIVFPKRLDFQSDAVRFWLKKNSITMIPQRRPARLRQNTQMLLFRLEESVAARVFEMLFNMILFWNTSVWQENLLTVRNSSWHTYSLDVCNYLIGRDYN